jgi:hypothetical protein
MSGNRRGGQHKLVITKKSLQYPVDPGNPGNVKIEKESDVAAETPLPSQALQLKLGLRVKRWATFLADYDPAFGAKFKTTLRLSPFAVHDNGFQVITVAFTHANHAFARDNYVFGISLLPGKNNAGVQLNLGPGGGGASAKKATKARTKARKPAKKSAKKAPRKSKGRARRNR